MERRGRGRPRHPGILTPAERRVLDALREGGTNADIAERLGIGAETVKTHISRGGCHAAGAQRRDGVV